MATMAWAVILPAAFIGLCSGTAAAALTIDISGVPGSGRSQWVFSGTSTVNQAGTIRTASTAFDLADDFEPDLTGNFIFNTGIQDQLFLLTGGVSISVGSDTQNITRIYLDDDGDTRDDIGIRTSTSFTYAPGENSSWTGSGTLLMDIATFNTGTFRLNTNQTNGGGFLFAQPNDVIMNFRRIPEPSAIVLLGCMLPLLGRRRRPEAA